MNKQSEILFNCNGNLIFDKKPLIMGILNITPDSFFDGGRYNTELAIKQKVTELVTQGADIIDVGAFSSRPGAIHVSEKEELNRLDFSLKIIRDLYPNFCISIDTFRSNVVKFAIENYKINIVNDIYAGTTDINMFETIAKYNVPYILMHMKGNPENMQNNPKYNDVVAEIICFFSERIKKATLLGINNLIIDPGFGFGKTIEHNYEILNRLDDFKIINYPLLVGLSRKSMIYKYLNTTPDDSLPATLALNTIAIQKGAKILRVHDVAQTVQIVEILNNIDYER